MKLICPLVPASSSCRGQVRGGAGFRESVKVVGGEEESKLVPSGAKQVATLILGERGEKDVNQKHISLGGDGIDMHQRN